ncbi:acyltransferase family protein [Pedobacter aquatilis]|uniref:acyltransferase family protein n=1 Tax=Pedobacter aquatilis TaxID=351343 RepID=UPI00292F9409|nr:acyltransferase family protein [Pedobacter aquatilis]
MLSASQSAKSDKLNYVSNIRVLLTVLVVLHHIFIAYSTSNGWYFTQKTNHVVTLLPMKLFVSLNQSFFMGFFFLLSAYFIGPSLDRKGLHRFVGDRLLRLGIPLLFYSFVLSPFISFLVFYFANGNHITYLQYLSGYDTWVDPGVMWFVAALLIFTLIYVLGQSTMKIRFKKSLPLPRVAKILIFAVLLGLVSFTVRILFPVGVVIKQLGFQLGHFPQYILLFIVGLAARRNNWFDDLSRKTGTFFKRSALIGLLFFPIFIVLQIKLKMPVSWYSGGFHWQSLLYALWEQWIGLSIIVALLSWSKFSWNCSSPLLDRLSRCSFSVYIFHPLVIVCLTLWVRNWTADPAIKALVVAPLAIICSFLLSSIILFIPIVKKII